MKDLIYLVLVIVAGVAVIKWYTSRKDVPVMRAVKKLSGAEALAQLEADADIVLLDVRTREEFAEGHIAGAVCIPCESIAAGEELPIGKDVKLFLYCRSGNRSAQAARRLAAMGYTDVTDFGGIIDCPCEPVKE